MNNSIADCATFLAAFPDDAKWNDAGDLVVPSGQAIAEALASYLSERGFKSSTKQYSYYAWLIEVAEGGVRIECLLQDLQPWILKTSAKGGLFNGTKRERLYRTVVGELMEAMISDSRFSEVRWVRKKCLQAQGKLKR